MCLKLFRNILQPLNVFGKDIRYVYMDLTKIPTEGGKHGHKTVNITWTGEEMVESHTIVTKSVSGTTLLPVKNKYINGNETEITLNIPDETGVFVKYPSGYQMFFRCEKVASLVVNGETLI